jgi:hypothetical protein
MLKGGTLPMTLISFSAFAGAAYAGEKLPIDGVYGDATSCELHRTGEYSERGDKLVLSADGLASMMWACDFARIEKAGDKTRVKLTCASEGSGPEDNYDDEAEISGDATAGFMVRLKDGGNWGPMKRCG